MFWLQDVFQEYPYLILLQSAFTIWMLVNAHRRGTDQIWFWVILIFQPIGPLAYFFLYKVGDLPSLGGLTLFQHRPPLNELRYRAEHVPTLANHLALAERLIEKQEYAEALPHLEQAKKREPEHGQVLYMMAKCLTEQDRPADALPLLETVLRRDRHFSDYAAWHLLIESRTATGDGAGALANCRELEKLSPTLRHRCLLAEHLMADGQAEEARTLLVRALEENAYLPGHIRRRNWRWARQARGLLKR